MHPFDVSDYFHDTLDIVSDFMARYHTFDEPEKSQPDSTTKRQINITYKEPSNADLRQIYFDEDRDTFVCPYCGETLEINPDKPTPCQHCQQLAQPY